MGKAQTVAAKVSDRLPEWDLRDLYSRVDAPELKADLASALKGAQAFAKTYAGKISGLNGDAVGKAIAEYEALQEVLGRLSSYAQLVQATDSAKPENNRFYQDVLEQVTDISGLLVFFGLELNALDEVELEKRMANSPALAKYRPWLRDVRAMRPYQLSEELERLLHEKQVTGASAWSRLFDETITRLQFPLGKEMVGIEAVLHRLSDKKAAVREQAAKSLGKVFGENIQTFAYITNMLAKDKAIEDKWRGFVQPIQSRNVANLIEDEVVDALISAVKGAYPALSHRYYQWKARQLGVEVMPYWDRNAPLKGGDEPAYQWGEARDLVLSAYRTFSPELARLGQVFFDKPWIDAAARPGKAPGAFAHPTVPSAHPYLLVNFQGKQRDVMTLAHELGHGVHQVLAGPQGALMSDTPLTLAETASVFGEQLTFRALLAGEKTKVGQKRLLARKVEDMLNTVVRQVAFCDFERRVHAARQAGELSADDIGRFWMEVQGESLGAAIRFDEEYRHFWAYIPHFIHSPFYVYAYAFGDCLVNALYAVYLEKPEGFASKYLEMLAAGGTKRHQELLAPFGLDATDPAFWQKGLSVISGMIDQLERLA